MRINTDGNHEYRTDLYDDVGEVLGEGTRSGAIDAACHFVLDMLGEPGRTGTTGALERALDHEDMTPALARELSTDQVSLRYEIRERKLIDIDD